ncbi:MerR family transcriptional regulator [Oceanobacter antarcticus]|jgi:DNA-binding transcriptional MerR regulator|uniref:MerR family transcriptional regulator n=1 Tax=Oceanobacter antarcticus TaxID=3133425 RepID=A0ABW8ND37_9GAMM|tara:strand:+ start:10747 stop:11664 length:918 start_codon:yes stop_codon:yes gene_type:complete
MTGNGSESHAAYYPIRIVSAETGINAITLRAWERRYGLIEPKRTAKGHRLYTEQDIQLIKRVIALLNRGIPISQAQAMLANGEADLDTPLTAAKPSQWQHYRELLQQATQDFDDRLLASTFDEVSQFFPVELALRFLFVPFYRQLRENSTQTLGSARLCFFTSFLQARLAWRLSESGTTPEQPRILLANCTRDSEINLLLLGLLIRQLGLGATRLSGLMALEQIIPLLNECRHWPVAVLQIEATPSTERIQQLHKIAAETGCPLFVTGQSSEFDSQLRQQGLVPLGDDYQIAALNVRDIVQGMTA